MMAPTVGPRAAVSSLAGRNDIRRTAREIARLVRPTGWLPGFVVLLIGWQAALFLALFGGAMRFGALAGIHIVGCFVLAAWLVWRVRGSVSDERSSIALQIVGWSAFAGPFGAVVATALTFPMAPIASRIAQDGDAEGLSTEGSAIEGIERLHIALLDRRIRLEGASRIRPLMDVIAEGSRSEKLEALRVIYRRYESGLSKTLKRALQDPDPSVRVLAATITAKLHATYGREIGDRQIEAAANPKLARPWQTLAEARLAYAESGLLESSRAQAQIEFAAGDLSRALEIDPTDRTFAGLFARALAIGGAGRSTSYFDIQESSKHSELAD